MIEGWGGRGAVRYGRCVRCLLVAGLMALGACTSYESAYERGVYDYEPIYCYQTLADISCMRTPHVRDERRLVNYYGPAPGKYERPEPPSMAPLAPPPAARPALLLQGAPPASSDSEDGWATDRLRAQETDDDEAEAAYTMEEDAGGADGEGGEEDSGEDGEEEEEEAEALPPDDPVLAI